MSCRNSMGVGRLFCGVGVELSPAGFWGMELPPRLPDAGPGWSSFFSLVMNAPILASRTVQFQEGATPVPPRRQRRDDQDSQAHTPTPTATTGEPQSLSSLSEPFWPLVSARSPWLPGPSGGPGSEDCVGPRHSACHRYLDLPILISYYLWVTHFVDTACGCALVHCACWPPSGPQGFRLVSLVATRKDYK